MTTNPLQPNSAGESHARSQRQVEQEVARPRALLRGIVVGATGVFLKLQEVRPDVLCREQRIRRQELRELYAYRAIALLCGPADYRMPPRAPKPSSGLVEQQRIFRRMPRRE